MLDGLEGKRETRVAIHGAGGTMPTYISALHWTDEGVRSFRDSREPAKAAGGLTEGMGGQP